MQLSNVYKTLGVVWGQVETVETGNMWSKTSASYRNRRRRRHSGWAGRKTANSDFWDRWSVFSTLFCFHECLLIYIVCIILMVFISFHKSCSKWRTRTSLQALQRRTMFWRNLSKIPDLFRTVSHAARILDTRSASACTYLFEGDVCYHMAMSQTTLPAWPTHNNRKFTKTVLLHSVYVVLLFTCICMLIDMWSTGTFIGCTRLWFMCVPSRVLWFFALELNSSYACQIQ